jgi:hypothetical protein
MGKCNVRDLPIVVVTLHLPIVVTRVSKAKGEPALKKLLSSPFLGSDHIN